MEPTNFMWSQIKESKMIRWKDEDKGEALRIWARDKRTPEILQRLCLQSADYIEQLQKECKQDREWFRSIIRSHQLSVEFGITHEQRNIELNEVLKTILVIIRGVMSRKERIDAWEEK